MWEALFKVMRALAPAVLLLSVGACTGQPLVRLHVCGDARVPNDFDAVRVSLLDETQAEIFSAVQELFVAGDAADAGTSADGGAADAAADAGSDADGGAPACTQGAARTLPRVFDLHDGRGRMWVVVEGLKDGVATVTADALVDQPVRGVSDVYVALGRACLGVRCAYGQTCGGGQCEIAVLGGDPEACDGTPYEGETVDACLPEEAAP